MMSLSETARIDEKRIFITPGFRLWLSAQTLAFWPVWTWMSGRMRDGSDDPMGILALGMLLLTLWRSRHHICQNANVLWLFISVLLTLLAAFLNQTLPPLLAGLIAMSALSATLFAFLPARSSRFSLFGMAVLALPLLSSLQFYAGYPLRVITAEVSSWLLMPFYSVSREGSILLVDAQMIMVDAPCSGVQMAWFGYFTAFSVALWHRYSDRHLALRLPFVGLMILAGNILRNSLLVALQANGSPVAESLHQLIGLVFLGLVCLGIIWLITKRGKQTDVNVPINYTSNHTPATTMSSKVTPQRASYLLTAGVICFILLALWQIRTSDAETNHNSAGQTLFFELPTQWDGKPLRPLALNQVEQKFAEGFPGIITPMTDGQRFFIFRYITTPTRKLHPATDCYRGIGFSIENEHLETDPQTRLWRCFTASKAEEKFRVCEHISNSQGKMYTDTSSWYWSAMMNPSTGPWTAITVAVRI